MANTSPAEILQQVTGGYFVSRCLQVVADLGVADHVSDQPVNVVDLAAATGSHAGALGRVLSLLSAYGIFDQRGGAFVHTATSRLLRTDDPRSMRSFVRMFGLPIMWDAAAKLDEAVKTGQSVANEMIPGGFWSYFAANPDASAIFDGAMSAKAHAQLAGLVSSYDFSGFKVIGDIGGGRGHLLQAILAAAPGPKGVLFDLPHVVQGATGIASDRLSLQAGDFFRDELPVCDAYTLMEVIHDWSDDDATKILKAVHRAALPHSKLLLIEAPIPGDPGPCWTKTLDIVMLDLLGGSQRTSDSYCELLAGAGFQLDRIIHVGTLLSIFEASIAK